jgi:polygalacturonase
MNRRTFLRNGGSFALIPAAIVGFGELQPGLVSGQSGASFDPRAHGAKGDGHSNDNRAIQRAIDECAHAGGGTVNLSPGTYLTGTIVLKSNMNFHLEAGATLLGSTRIEDYAETLAANDKRSYHLIHARGADNLSITGQGAVNGQGPSFWVPTNRPQPAPEDLWKDVVTKDWKPLTRPSPMIDLAECRNLTVRDITIANSPGWTFRMTACDTVTVQGIKIRNPIYGINVDGIDVTCCSNVQISDCDIATADDAICLKSENAYSDVTMTRNITATNCKITGCCNGFKIGTGTSGQFENIVASNLVIYNPDVPYNQRIISGISLEMVDGGSVDGVNISGIQMQRSRAPIFVRLGNRNGSPGTLRNVSIQGVQAAGAIICSSISGLQGAPVQDVRLSDIHIESAEAGRKEWASAEIPEQAHAYPESKMFGRLPAYGLYCRHAEGIQINGFEIAAAPSEGRPAMVFDDVINSEIAGLRLDGSHGSHPVELEHCHNVKVTSA